MSPSVAALPLFLAARACPLSLRTFLAPSTSPSDFSSARFTSIIPAAVSSRSCLIFSIVLAKVLTSPQSLRSPRPEPHLRLAQTRLRLQSLLSLAPPPQAPRRLPVRRPPGRQPPPRHPPFRRYPFPRSPLRRLPVRRPPCPRPPTRPFPFRRFPFLVPSRPRTRPRPRSPPRPPLLIPL